MENQNKKNKIKEYYVRLKENYILRTLVFASFSFFVTIGFCLFNLFIGIRDQIAWNISIGVYYLLLVVIKILVGYHEIKWKKQHLNELQKEEKRETIYLTQSILLLIIDLALITPITLMMLQEKEIHYSSIAAITIATYTVYKIVMASINFYKTRKLNHLSVKIVRNINFVDALVSILTLQYTLIMTFGTGMDDGLKVVCSLSSFAIWGALITISIFSLIQSIKGKNKKMYN